MNNASINAINALNTLLFQGETYHLIRGITGSSSLDVALDAPNDRLNLSVNTSYLQNTILPYSFVYRGIVSSTGTIISYYSNSPFSFTVTKISTGDYRINFSDPFFASEYIVICSSRNTASCVNVSSGNHSSLNCRIFTRRTDTFAYLDTEFNFAIR